MSQAHALQRAPVAFLIFNRPAFTARVFDAIAQARPSRLLVVADGPRPTHPDDPSLCREARAVIERVDWPCEVLTEYSETNMGCKLRIATGLDWVFRQADEAIVLEDDTLPDPSFFTFCEELLARYRDDRRVHMISGCNVVFPRRFSPSSYYFSRLYQIWGWASWARAWDTYDLEMRAWPELRETDWLARQLGGETEAAIARTIFELTYEGKVPTWDFQWAFAGLAHDALSIRPSVNLVTNIGFGAAGTHERDPSHGLANLPSSVIEFPLRHPAEVAVLQDADVAEWRHLYPDRFRGPTSSDGGVRRVLRSAWRSLARL
jgi:hypothetical protein